MRRTITPLGALLRGALAGAAGAAAQSLAAKLTTRIAPANPQPRKFRPPEEAQQSEVPTHTVARRFVESLMARGPLEPADKRRGGRIVHYAFGGLWGGLYGLARESCSSLASPLTMLGFSTAVWILGDNVIVPAFRLGPWADEIPAKNHLYYFGLHLAYGVPAWAIYELARPRSLAAFAAALWGLGVKASLRRVLPRPLRPASSVVVDALAKVKVLRPRLAEAVAGPP